MNFMNFKKIATNFIFVIFTDHHTQSHAHNDYCVKISNCKPICYSSSHFSELSISMTM